jgi:hypothetical protein
LELSAARVNRPRAGSTFCYALFTHGERAAKYRSREETDNMFTRELEHEGHVRRFEVTNEGADGWEVRVEEDRTVLRRRRYTDWHRVERALTRVTLEIAELQNAGWTLRPAAT